MRNRETISEYVTGSLWVLPGFSAALALAVGFALSRIRIDPGRRWRSRAPPTMRAPC